MVIWRKNAAVKLVSEIIIQNQKISEKYGNGKVGVKKFKLETWWKKWAIVKNIKAGKSSWKIKSENCWKNAAHWNIFFNEKLGWKTGAAWGFWGQEADSDEFTRGSFFARKKISKNEWIIDKNFFSH